ncbi:MAG: lamin tail domain-containing protein [Pseudomonadota bacterium]
MKRSLELLLGAALAVGLLNQGACGGSTDSPVDAASGDSSQDGSLVDTTSTDVTSVDTALPDTPLADAPLVPLEDLLAQDLDFLDTATDSSDETDPPDIVEGPVIRISELMADNDGVLLDGDGDASDWLELYNPGPATVALGGWGLSDDAAEPWLWTLPGETLVPGGCLLIFASGKAESPAGELHAAFKLSSAGEGVWLTRPDGSTADALTFPGQHEGVSYGLAQDVDRSVLVTDGDSARLSLSEAAGWTEPDFDDAGWDEVVMGVGYDGGISDEAPENRALFQPTGQSSDGYGFTGMQATDGELSSFSHTGDGDLEPWWSVELPENTWITVVRLHNRVGCCPERLYNLTVEVLDGDGAVTWTSEVLNPVAEGETPTDPGTMLEVVLEVVGRSVRVSKVAVNGPGSSEWLSFAEVEVMGTPASPYHGEIATDLEETMKGVSASAWLRIPFPTEPADRLILSARYDDGLVVWLGGAVVAQDNAGEGVALEAAQGDAVFTLDPALLQGTGLLAIQGLNVKADDDDFLVRVTLEASTIETGDIAWFPEPTPGAPNNLGVSGFLDPPEVDIPRGFFDDPLQVTLSSAVPGARIVYTLDGTRPTEDVGVVFEGIDGGPPFGLVAIDTTTTLRAAAFQTGWEPSPVVTHTYLFLDDVIHQPASPDGLPAVWDGASQGPIAADYEMDPEVVDDPAYAEDLLSGLRDIPTLSLVLDPEDLFGAEDGLYVHSLQRGDEWERPVSAELILPDGSTGFQENCGVRIHGYGWRHHSNTLKHSLRLEFRSKYGVKKLEYPLFPDAPAGVERFDSIVLRSQGSRGWQDFRDPEQAQYIRDAFARDTARDMGKIDGHAIYVHLYLNGLYWGALQPGGAPGRGLRRGGLRRRRR